jgi:succinate-semialdehyde dehydrogenase/glutarate-semialdehyde dehydrogenase
MLRRTLYSAERKVDVRKVLRDASLFVEGAYVDGKTVAESKSGEKHDVLHACTQTVMGTIPCFTQEETTGAIESSNRAFKEWSETSAMKRSRVLWKWAQLMETHQSDLAAIMAAESGKAFKEAEGEIAYSRNFVEWYAGEAERVYGDIIPVARSGVRALVRKQPVGVVAVITPWNFPSAMITRATAGALAAGCTVVVKPSELTPYSATALAKLATEAGVPAGGFNVVTGQSHDIGPVLTSSSIVRKLSFTGSTAVGVKLYEQCAKTVKKLALELGGNAPVIICEDADLDMAVDGVMAAKYRNSGQACIAANRIFVAASVHDKFVEKLVARVKKDLKLGDAGHENLPTTDKDATLGPVISVKAGKQVAERVARAVEQGAKIVIGGKHLKDRPLNFYEPTILTNVTNEMEITDCEIFGPVASIIKYKDGDLDGVVHAANNVPVGLAAYVFTSDYRKQWRLSEALEYGMVGVNEGAISNPACPFGGMKQSGLGRDGSKYGIDAFLEQKYVLMGGKI